MRLTDIQGVGDATASRLVDAFGSEAAVLEAVTARDVARLAAVDGVGERKAVELVLSTDDAAAPDFMRTPRARALYEDVLDRIRDYANTDQARARLALLVPLGDRKAMEARLAEADRCVKEVTAFRDALPDDRARPLLRRLHPPRTPRPRFDAGVVVLVDDEHAYERLVKAGIDRYARLATPEDGGIDDAEVVVYAYSQGNLDLQGVENVVPVPFTDDPGALVPESVIRFFEENRTLWDAALELTRARGGTSVMPEVLELLDQVRDGAQAAEFAPVEEKVREVVAEMNAEVAERVKSLSLTGEEALAMMEGRPPKAIGEIRRGVLKRGRERIMEATGEDAGCFTDAYPFTIDEEALARVEQRFVARQRRRMFQVRVDAARRLTALKKQAEAEVRDLLDFDRTFAIGAFVLDHGLTRPTFGNGWHLKGALHLSLAKRDEHGQPQGMPVDYHLGKPQRVALLTGANSGGKTTLLETLAHVALLAHMGLPVPAEEATVEPVEALYFFTQARGLDAGAFESFLRALLPVAADGRAKLVLGDELEAMTELSAAGRIVAAFVEMLADSQACGVCVSHMAEEVVHHVRDPDLVRIDGIEAKGLDEEYNLIVDRTPRLNHHARSTPELILRRLHARSKGKEKDVYGKLLARFEGAP